MMYLKIRRLKLKFIWFVFSPLYRITNRMIWLKREAKKKKNLRAKNVQYLIEP